MQFACKALPPLVTFLWVLIVLEARLFPPRCLHARVRSIGPALDWLFLIVDAAARAQSSFRSRCTIKASSEPRWKCFVGA